MATPGTLTLYTAHVMYINSPLDVFDATLGYLVQVTAALLFAHFWHQTTGRGPLEAVVTKAAHAARHAVMSPSAPTSRAEREVEPATGTASSGWAGADRRSGEVPFESPGGDTSCGPRQGRG